VHEYFCYIRMLHYIIYISKAAKLLTEVELIDLLEESRAWNLNHGITGMLMYLEGNFSKVFEGRFIQVLEGSKDEVTAIFQQIKKDKRHREILLLKEAESNSRAFEDWAMGFRGMNLADYEAIPGCFPLENLVSKNAELMDSNIPYHFLKSFYQMSQTKI